MSLGEQSRRAYAQANGRGLSVSPNLLRDDALQWHD